MLLSLPEPISFYVRFLYHILSRLRSDAVMGHLSWSDIKVNHCMEVTEAQSSTCRRSCVLWMDGVLGFCLQISSLIPCGRDLDNGFSGSLTSRSGREDPPAAEP